MNFSTKTKIIKKKSHKNGGQKHNWIFEKIIETPSDFQLMECELFLEKKQAVFIYASRKKKLQGFEWMSEPWTFPRK